MKATVIVKVGEFYETWTKQFDGSETNGFSKPNPDYLEKVIKALDKALKEARDELNDIQSLY